MYSNLEILSNKERMRMRLFLQDLESKQCKSTEDYIRYIEYKKLVDHLWRSHD